MDGSTNETVPTELTLTADEQILANLGYKQEFKREFTPLEVFGIAFSIIGLLPSIASVLTFAIPNGGPFSMVWGWAICCLFILTVGLAMGELASAAPTSGGLYFWTYALSSPKWRNLLCWFVGYANSVSTIAAVASIDWGCAIQITAAASIGSDGTFSATNAQNFGTYALVVLSHAVVCSLGTKLLARLQTVYVVLNVLLCLAVIIAIPACTSSELRNPPSYAFGNYTNLNGWTDGYAFFLSWLAPAWTVGSYDSAVHISEEAANAATAVPRGIVGAIAIAGVLGWGIQVALTFSMGTDLQSIVNDPTAQPMATIFRNALGKQGTLALWSIVIIVQYMMGSSMLLASSRQIFAFSRDGALPFSSWLYRMNKYTGAPVNTVWFSALLAICLGLLVFAGTAAIGAIFSLGVVATYTSYSIPIAARWLGDNHFKPGPFNLGNWSRPISVIALLYMCFMILVFLFPTSPQTSATTMNYATVVVFGVLILSILWYYFPKYGGHKWFKGPISTIEQAIREADSADGPKEKKMEVVVRVKETENSQ